MTVAEEDAQIHPMLDTNKSVQSTNLYFAENRVLLFQLLMEPLVSCKAYGFNLFHFQAEKEYSFKTSSCMTFHWSRLDCLDSELRDDRHSSHTGVQARRSVSFYI